MSPRDDVAGILLSELRHVASDLQSLIGAPLQDTWVPDPNTVVLGLTGGRQLLLSTWPVPRVHTTDRRPRNPAKPYSFQGLLRRRLTGRVEAIEVVNNDRILAVRIGQLTLHVRLFGRGGGIWLMEDDVVLAASDGPAAPSLPPFAPPPPDEHPPRFEPHDGSWDAAAERYFSQAARAHVQRTLRTRVTGHLKRAVAKQKRLIRAIEGDLVGTERADTLRHQADCLAAALHTLRKGDAQAVVPDLNEPDVMLTIALDRTKGPAATMNKMYDKAGRLDRAVDHLLTRLDEAQQRALVLRRDLDTALEADIPTLRALAKTWSVHIEATRPPQRTTAPFVTWQGPRDQEIWVGRNDKSNHALVFRKARGRDWWLHVRDQPGAHVVIPTASKTDAPPLELLLAAAQIALHHSGVDTGLHVDVQYARVADVRPLKGAGPGRVQVLAERVIHVTRDPKALEGWQRIS